MTAPNQFLINEEEKQAIIDRNKKVHPSKRTCFKCGHEPDPDYSDYSSCTYMMSNLTMRGNWEDLDEEDVKENGDVFPPHICCNGECTYF